MKDVKNTRYIAAVGILSAIAFVLQLDRKSVV